MFIVERHYMWVWVDDPPTQYPDTRERTSMRFFKKCVKVSRNILLTGWGLAEIAGACSPGLRAIGLMLLISMTLPTVAAYAQQKTTRFLHHDQQTESVVQQAWLRTIQPVEWQPQTTNSAMRPLVIEIAQMTSEDVLRLVERTVRTHVQARGSYLSSEQQRVITRTAMATTLRLASEKLDRVQPSLLLGR